MKKIILFITLALVTSSAQPVTREKLEKAHNVTGIASAIGDLALGIIPAQINNYYHDEQTQAYASRNLDQINTVNTKIRSAHFKASFIEMGYLPVYAAHKIIGAALEKDDALVTRLISYHVYRMVTGITKSHSPDKIKNLVIEIAIDIIHEILRFGVYKGVAKNFEDPDSRIKRRVIRTVTLSLITGLLELAQNMTTDQSLPYKESALIDLVSRIISEVSGEILCRRIEEIPKETTTEQVVPQVN